MPCRSLQRKPTPPPVALSRLSFDLSDASLDNAMHRMGVQRTIDIADSVSFNDAMALPNERCLCVLEKWETYKTYRPLINMHRNILVLMTMCDGLCNEERMQRIARSIHDEGGNVWYRSHRHIAFARFCLTPTPFHDVPPPFVVPLFAHAPGTEELLALERGLKASQDLFYAATHSTLRTMLVVGPWTDLAVVDRIIASTAGAGVRLVWYRNADTEYPTRGWFLEWNVGPNDIPPSLLAELYICHVNETDTARVVIVPTRGTNKIPCMRRLDATHGVTSESSTVCVEPVLTSHSGM